VGARLLLSLPHLSFICLLSVLITVCLCLIFCQVIGDHQCGFQHNRSANDQIFCICQIQEKRWVFNETVHQLFIDLNKEGVIVQYSHRVWGIHEASLVY
jgi:hypothetical protein